MGAVVAAFTGLSGSGTSTLARRTASILNWPYASFGAYVRSQAAKEGLQGTRKELQDLGLTLLNDVDAFCRAVIASSLWRPGENLVIDGVRHQSVLNALNRILGETKVTTIYINADSSFRLAHLRNRGEVPADGVALIDAHTVEQEVVNNLSTIAEKQIDVRYRGESDPDWSEEELVDSLVEFLVQVSEMPPYQARVTREHLIRVPWLIRNKLKLKPGDLMEFSDTADCIIAAKVVDQERIRSVFGRLRKELQGVDPVKWIRDLRTGGDSQKTIQ